MRVAAEELMPGPVQWMQMQDDRFLSCCFRIGKKFFHSKSLPINLIEVDGGRQCCHDWKLPRVTIGQIQSSLTSHAHAQQGDVWGSHVPSVFDPGCEILPKKLHGGLLHIKLMTWCVEPPAGSPNWTDNRQMVFFKAFSKDLILSKRFAAMAMQIQDGTWIRPRAGGQYVCRMTGNSHTFPHASSFVCAARKSLRLEFNLHHRHRVSIFPNTMLAGWQVKTGCQFRLFEPIDGLPSSSPEDFLSRIATYEI